MLQRNFDQTLLWAKETLEEEAKSLLLAANNLDHNFSSSIKAILECKGKLIVTGLGKSGHVAKKIAATFSSCGAPSIYLHPSEALHGDLGLIEDSDILLAIAYSGETYETLKVAKYAQHMGLPIISITGELNSSLALLSDFCLNGNVPREVCPNELAPTSSTTVAMVLGDALAVSLMKAKNFKSQDFARYHPEGLLGRKLTKVFEYTRKNTRAVPPDLSFDKVIEHMSEPNYGVTVVSSHDEKKILGIITDGDLRRFLLQKETKIKSTTASDIMTKNPKSICENNFAYQAAKIMENLKISALVVTDSNNHFSGILRLQDLITAKIV